MVQMSHIGVVKPIRFTQLGTSRLLFKVATYISNAIFTFNTAFDCIYSNNGFMFCHIQLHSNIG